jgi:diguanylate cyclase (GGDEF)-like protein/PAS domain S-box-containing protein
VELLGYTQFELLALSSWDISAELDKSADVLTRLLHGEHIPIFERLFRKKSGEVIPVEINVEIVRDAGGKPMHLQSVVRDITERKCAEEVLRESEIRYRIVADNTHDWEFWQLSDGQFLYTSPSCKRITGYDAQEFMSNPDLMLAIVHPEDRDNYLKHQRRTNSNQTPGEVEFRILLPDGSIVWIGHVCQPVFDDRGNYLGARGSNRNITLSKQTEVILKQANADLRIRVQQVENLQMELREQAIRDPLTNLYNRRYLNETLERDLARMKREKKPLSVIMIDLDHFKSVNDTYGHLTGDQFLIKLAQIISNSARGSDIACRYGGEEFLLVMPGASANAAFKRAEEIRRLCARTHVLCGAEKVRVTASLGVAAFPLHGRQGSDLIAKADVALYISKANGRNKVTLCCEKQTRAAHK